MASLFPLEIQPPLLNRRRGARHGGYRPSERLCIRVGASLYRLPATREKTLNKKRRDLGAQLESRTARLWAVLV